MTPLKAIRAKCMDCMYEQINEIRLCPCTDCPLWEYRLGHNPNIKHEMTPARVAATEKLKSSRISQKTT